MDPRLVRTPIEQHHSRLAQVLFMDVVAYTKLKMRDQLGVNFQLTDIVRNTDEYGRKEASDSIICRPLGDGMAVVFFADPSAPVRCAIEISRNIRRQGAMRLRMGIHSGPVFCHTDINLQADVTGEGINTAQRVMASGDPNHILLSRPMAEILMAEGDWNDYISEIGPVEVKHGGKVFLYNFASNEFGNPARSTKWPALREERIPFPKRPALREERIPLPKRQSTDLKCPPVSRAPDCERCGMLIPFPSTTCEYCGAKLLDPK